jgi:hypothetical protein
MHNTVVQCRYCLFQVKNVFVLDFRHKDFISDADPGCLSRIPDPTFFHPGSGSLLFQILPIPDPGVKKAPDPGSGSATLDFIKFAVSGLEKTEDEQQAEDARLLASTPWKTVSTSSSSPLLRWGGFAPPPASLPASSPDLGFVDFSEHHQHLPEFLPHHLHHHRHRHRHDDDDDDASNKTGTTTTTNTTTPGCDTPEEDATSPTVIPFFCSIGGREATTSSDAASNKTAAKLNRYTTTTTSVHKSAPPTTTVHLNKKVTVQLEKLPMIFSSDSSSGGSERKRRLAAGSQLPLAGSSKCARLEPAAASTLVRTKDLNVSSVADVLNSFRICKPKPASAVVAAAGAKQNFPSFEPLSFCKKPSAGGGSYPTLNRSSNSSYSPSEILLRKDCSADAQNQSSVSSPTLESETTAVTTESTTTNSCLKSNFNASSGPTATAAAVAAATTVNNNNVKFSSSHEVVASPAAAAKATAVLGDGPAKALPGSEDFARPFRFPTVPGNHSAIPCKWEACSQGFKTHGKLSDHIKVKNLELPVHFWGQIRFRILGLTVLKIRIRFQQINRNHDKFKACSKYIPTVGALSQTVIVRINHLNKLWLHSG